MYRKDSSNPSPRKPGARGTATRPDPLERARNSCPVRISFPHPLSWWRTRRPEDFREVDIPLARHFLAKSAIIGEPYWFLAGAGNAGVAMSVARRALRHEGGSPVVVDVAMTAILCIALEGHVAARLFLAAILKQRADAGGVALSDSWLCFSPPWM